MKLRVLKKKHPSKLERIWIKHLIEWKYYNGEYKTIRKYYIESCKNILDKFFEILTFISKLVVKVDSSLFLTLKFI